MKHMLILLYIIFGIQPFINAQTAIALVDLNQVYDSLPEVKIVNEKLESYRQKLANRITIKYDHFYDIMGSHRTHRLSKEEAQEMTLEVNRLNQELKNETKKAEEMLHIKKDELFFPIQQKVEAFMKAYSAENGYLLIINQSRDKALLPKVLYAKEKVPDITLDVIRGLK